MRRPSATSRRAAVVFACLALGCDRGHRGKEGATSADEQGGSDPTLRRGAAKPTEPSAARPAPAPAAAPSPSDPLPLTGNLQSELDTFTTVEACIAQRAPVDSVIGDTLDAIGYETIARDGCQTLLAAKTGRPDACAAIEVSAVRHACESVTAEVSGNPEACPWEVTARPERGRDPECLAVASLDGRLCAAVLDSTRRTACRARIESSEAPCLTLRVAERSRCARDQARWSALIGRRRDGSSPQPGPMRAAAGNVTVTWLGGGADAPAEHVDLNADLARGVVLRIARGEGRFEIGTVIPEGLDPIALSPHAQGTFGLELAAPVGEAAALRAAPEGRSAVRVESAELAMPQHERIAFPPWSSSLQVHGTRMEARRGSPVVLRVSGELGSGPDEWRVEGEVETFVRDVIHSEETAGQGEP